ncbi:MAG: signal peptidase I [Candidatus Tokpelaia sp. JSC161]|jgi:signal peptidase I|nr:MAG: signal peptidase I [Candidatus Tokpelaia sp. JSC161]
MNLQEKKTTKETLIVVIEALLLACVIRTFLFQPFTIPSGSMRPTLLVGDYLFVSKYAYGYSRFSFPFSPKFFSGRIWSAEPKRGDIVVFRHPENTSIDYIKRVIGLPGDKIQMRAGVLYINNLAVKRTKIAETKNVDLVGSIPPSGELFDSTRDLPVSVYRETLPNNISYNTFDILEEGPGDNTRVYQVPEGHYFMLGDNRDNSLDSRFSLGYIPFENLIGRANILFFSIGGDSSAWQIWRWPAYLRWERLFRFVNMKGMSFE